MEHILIIDFGSQVTQLIARRIREFGVFCKIHPFHKVDIDFIKKYSPKGIVLSGGPESVYGKNSPQVPKEIFATKIPILGICYGQQLMCQKLGGKVATSSTEQGEFGRAKLDIIKSCPLFDGIWQVGDTPIVWMSHKDKIVRIPEDFDVFAVSQGAPYAVIANQQKTFYGVQFHPEVIHTPDGAKLINNFLQKICLCQGGWTVTAFKERAIENIRKKVGGKKVICGVSGGVDSSVVAVLLHEAVGENLTCIFVDHGLLRSEEANQVVKLFKDHYKIRLMHCNAQEVFLAALDTVSDPEQKRKIIGKVFIDIFEQEAKKVGGADFLAQGTLYPDVIESVSSVNGAVVIKSHHNVGGLPEKMRMQLVEPLRELFKDEVRLLGKELGLPDAFINRHPFPGPGLAIRIPGVVTKEKCDILRKIDAIFIEQIQTHNLYDNIWQAFAVLLPVKSVGVMGDNRTYKYVCALRAVTSNDGMTADVYPFDTQFLTETATRIINEVKEVNRVVYDYTSKPPGTIEWE